MSEAYLGEIRMFAGLKPPKYWQFCNGQILNISEYQALYALIGIAYGGNGTTTFALPDLRGKTPIGQGAGAGLTPRTIGQAGGTTTVTLTAEQIPAHTHLVLASTANATTDTPGTTVVLGSSGTNTTLYTKNDPSDTHKTAFVFDSNAIAASGANLPHNNVTASYGINFIICVVNGVFPSRP